MIWDIIEDKLTAAGLGLVGNTMFREHMPAEIRKGILMRSPMNGIQVDPYIKDFYKSAFQVIVRDVEREAGNQIAKQVMKALVIEGEQVFPATAEREEARILRLYPNRLPITFPRLDGNGLEWSLNFDIIFSCKYL